MTILSYAAIYLIWGSTFLAIRFALDSFPPLLMMGLRCIAAGTLLLAWARLRGHRADARAWRRALISGSLMFGVAYGALAWAEVRMPSGIAALLVATVPLWMTVFDCAQRRDAPSARTAIGLAVGLSGVGLLVARSDATSFALMPAVALLIGEAAWAAGALYARGLPSPVALNAGMPLVTGGALLVAASAAIREFRHFDPRAVSTVSIAALVYLVVFGSIVAFSAYAWLMRVAPASRVGTHAYVNPLIAVALGCMVGGEPFTSAVAVASLVIAAGVALVLA